MALLVLLSVMVPPPSKSRLPALTKPLALCVMLLALPALSVMVFVPEAVRPALSVMLPP